jgi:putative tryptophan/tyrosine transport system substrate-binding protein
VQAYTGITIIMASPTSANLEFIHTFRTDLLKAKSSNLRVKVIDLSTSEKFVVAENSELVVALGVKALQAASKLKLTTPVLGVFTPLTTFNSVFANSRRTLGNFSAIVLDQPYSRRFSLVKAVMPDIKSLGVLLGSNSVADIEEFKQAGGSAQFDIIQISIKQEKELIPSLTNLLETSDALMAIPDSLVYTRETAQPILLTSYRHQKPVFAYSQSYVRAGALAAVYSNSRQLAKQTAEIAIQSQPGILPPPQAPKYFSVIVNYQVARSLNIQVASEDKLYKKITYLESIP